MGENSKTKWYISHLSLKDEDIEYIHLEEVNKNEFRNEMNPVFDYEYMENLKSCVSQNFLDFDEAIKKMIKDHTNNTDVLSPVFIKKHQINIQRTFFNLINTHKMLLDHMMHTLSSRQGKKSQDQKILNRLMKYYYDNHPGYKIIENLRNYCQHKNMVPLEIIRQPPSKESKGSLYVNINKEFLLDDGVIKKKLKLELASPHPFDFMLLTFDWITEVHQIYEYFFDIFAKISEQKASKLLNYISLVHHNKKDENLNLYLVGDISAEKKSFTNTVLQQAMLPIGSCFNIMERFKSKAYNERIEFINNLFNDDTNEEALYKERCDMYGEDAVKKVKEIIDSHEMDTLTLKSINTWLKNSK